MFDTIGDPKVEVTEGLSHTTVPVKDWIGLDDAVSLLLSKDWVFRGHQDEKWTLQSSLERSAVGIDLADAERLVIDECQRDAHNHLSGRLPRTAAEWHSLIQHHGGPMRLLDWTSSPYVAIFFAVEEIAEKVERTAVWAVDWAWCNERTAERIGQDGFVQSLRHTIVRETPEQRRVRSIQDALIDRASKLREALREKVVVPTGRLEMTGPVPAAAVGPPTPNAS